ncbi:Aldehyde ferredoxin oxidoreductase [Ferroglobus placidus DSM 10642]|uniref:Aldehyde ferredoxin oxidoreductase n=1 Tax=Ferroglobus placidus (strain DSM 10642 / AEDII12DO) TaxID=589924 RepID=D3RY23_FERPA|nr:aldehyde ferredoxin oxidoreductase family protein [Ferroglobus placidus]ADC65386.1 Aldehyde ferredoxin oxidoreductase [Ferroglobus placidus DSM 10642]
MLSRKVAFVDLSKEKVVIRDIPRELRKKHLGGRGLNWYYIYNNVPPEVKPFDPENILAVGVGLLCGMPALGASRTHIAAKSPLTGGVGDANMGGAFGAELRFAGIDHIIIRGRAEKPVYLYVRDGEVEIRDASHLWGLDTYETQREIKEELGDDRAECMVIGKAGENMVAFANVMNNVKNAGGRGGTGAVMGSKNLKAIAASGGMDLEVYDVDKFVEYCMELNKQILSTKWAKTLSKLGTPLLYDVSYTTGFIGTLNWQFNTPGEEGKPLEAENLLEYNVKHTACIGCSVHCRHRVKIEKGKYAGLVNEGPEYTMMGTFGTLVGVYDWEFVIKGNELCNKWGIDNLSLGAMMAWAFELYQRGYLTEEDVGFKLEWGDRDAVLRLAEMIVNREGIGDILARGPKEAIKALGEETAYYLNHVKGQPNLHTDERGIPSFALGIATSTRGADHLRSRPAIDLFQLPKDFLKKLIGYEIENDFTAYETKGILVWWYEVYFNVVDSLGICKFHSVFNAPHAPSYDEYVKIIYYATGLEFTKEDLITIGERNYTMERLFNLMNGMSKKDDYPYERYFKEPAPRGLPFMRGRKLDRDKYEMMLQEYYKQHGWDENGVPKEETLKRLGIEKPKPNFPEVE